jgi:hypothetical protein
MVTAPEQRQLIFQLPLCIRAAMRAMAASSRWYLTTSRKWIAARRFSFLVPNGITHALTRESTTKSDGEGDACTS